MKKNKYLLLFLLSCMWGPSFLLLKIAIKEIQPITIACLRSVIGALILIAIVKSKKYRFPKLGLIYVHFLLIGFFSIALPFSLITWGERFIQSALAAILNGTVPLYALLITFFFIQEEKIDMNKIIGLMLGFTGVAILLYPSFSSEEVGKLSGVIAVSIAAVSYAIGAVYGRIKMKGQEPFIAPAMQLLGSSLILIPVSLIFERPLKFLPLISLESILSISYLCFFGSAIAYILYFKILDVAGVSFLTNVTYIMPVYGILLGYIFLNEKLTFYTYLGALLILIGICISGGLRIGSYKKSTLIIKK